MIFSALNGIKKGVLSSAVFSSALLLGACDNQQEAEKLGEAIDVAEKEIVSISLSSKSDKDIFEPGETWQFTATGTTSRDKELDISDDVTWSLSDSSHASFDGDGTLTAKNFTGLHNVTAKIKWGQFEDSMDITLSDAALTALSVSVNPNPLDECRSAILSATGTYEDGSMRDMSGVVYASNDTTKATVSGESLITHDSGSINVTGSKSGITSAVEPVTISETLAALTISQGSTASIRTGSTLSLSSKGDYTGGSSGVSITNATSWESSKTDIATVSDSGKVTAKTVGETTITASCGGLDDTIEVSVLNVTGIVIVSPTSDELDPGDTVQLKLYEELSDGSRATEDLADEDKVIWVITVGGDVASINSDGKVTMDDSFDDYSQNYIRITADYGEYDDEIELFLNK
ncbi:hypothetical protein BTA51_20090 [Hahella sp. CCB-MM4]|uniref:Ig-like domain-containing protein n=1 Tax=Hahella sp. (strain CCB-MM4) TaxID=1926491 RepID=UPI000B9A3835|nr:Ig-like domain-containing protein [Hahella sp. CCB-MM4]OZG71585.1 hypothetical protein BTA51_20090 [Hahella sp. CCB-MM4]